LLHLRAEVTKKLPIYKGQIVETGEGDLRI